jgi:hypothetical protein
LAKLRSLEGGIKILGDVTIAVTGGAFALSSHLIAAWWPRLSQVA